LARVLRLDRLQIAALRETLVDLRHGARAARGADDRMLALSADEVGRRAEGVAREASRLALR